MSTHLRQKEEKLEEILADLKEAAKDAVMIVEGKKDVQALSLLSVNGNILTAKTGGKSLMDVVTEIELIRPREVILLLDYDRRGREWTSRLKHFLEQQRIKADTTFWAGIFGLVGKEVKDIEGLPSYMETLKSKMNNS